MRADRRAHHRRSLALRARPARQPACRERVMAKLLLARRQLADVSRLLRPAGGHVDGERAGHQRRVRVHVDVHLRDEGAAARSGAGGVRPARADVPPRWPTPTYKATRNAAPDILEQQMGLVREVLNALGVPVIELSGYEADDLIATATEQAVEPRRRRRHRHRRPRLPTSSCATRTSRSSTTAAASATTRSTTRPGILERDRCHAGPVPRVRGAARRPQRQPARRPGGRGEDGGQADQHLRRARRDLRATSTSRRPKLRASLAEHEERVRKNLEMMILRRDAPIEIPETW